MEKELDISFEDESSLYVLSEVEVSTSDEMPLIIYDQDNSATAVGGERPTECVVENADNPRPVKDSRSTPRTKTKCSSCTYSTTSRGNMYRHVKSVHERTSVTCDVCGMKFRAKYDLRQHITHVHENVQLLCEVCSMSFHNRHTLIRHKKIAHSEAAKYTCTLCNKTFFEKAHYHGHINSHVRAKPYSCSNCNKSYPYKSSYLRHFLICKGPPNEKYKCSICEKQLKGKASFDDHVQGKHGNKNKFCHCGKAFAWRSALSHHKKNCKIAKSHA